MSEKPLTSLPAYSRFVAECLDRPTVQRSTVIVWSASPYTGVAEGEVFFRHGFRLRVREEIDFDTGLITSYGYEAYREDERLYWYDDFPHPYDSALASTLPHHKHVPPAIKHHRIPVPALSFTRPNLPLLVNEVDALVVQEEGRE